MFETFMKQQQERKDQLELMFPEQIVKEFSLSLLKKIGHILDIPSYNGKSKRELIHAIITKQDEYDGKFDPVFFCVIEDDVCKSLKLNKDCDFYQYMIANEK
ncbi:hypothetical protein ACQKNX_07850 [Lysinibacillus sp. NPDC093712]|uniref:hypothetical protein n=1 Tax=Lysinibacillus sp. NPDC093712 TaxID=3390579 RepID=UPI003D003E73